MLTSDVLLAARGRGIANLIEGIQNGDPVAITITVVLVLAVIGYIVIKMRSAA